MNNQRNPTNSQRNHGFNTNEPNVLSSRTIASIPTVAQPFKPPRELWTPFTARLVLALCFIVLTAVGIAIVTAIGKGK